jgi:SRSO17 transposase
MERVGGGYRATRQETQRWGEGFARVAALLGKQFARAEPRQRAMAYLRGLISPIERKNGWQLAEYAGEKQPYGMQHVLGRAVWSADAVRDDLRTYVVEHLGEADAVLVVDETGFLKKGTKSVGVARQYSGTAGRVENCQIGVFLVYATARGRTFLDRELYLPRAWATDRPGRTAAGVPETVRFMTKPQLARQMIARALAAGVPCGWVTGDSVYGSDWRMRSWLEERQLSYVLGVTAQYRVLTGHTREWAAAVVKRLPEEAWTRVSCGAGSKGERMYDWARLPLREVQGERQRWLLARRRIGVPTETAYYVAAGPRDTSMEQLARVAGTRWAIEESFKTAKGEVGLDQYEVRSWPGWYRHVTLALFAHAYLTVIRATAIAGPHAQKKARTRSEPHRRRPCCSRSPSRKSDACSGGLCGAGCPPRST